MSTLVLHTYWRSSSSFRVRIALAYKRLSYQSRFVNILAGDQQGEYRLTSPTGYVPCLEIDGHKFGESVAIMELLEELHPEPALYPKRPEERARVRAMVEMINSGVQPMQNLSVLAKVGEDKAVRLAWMTHFVQKGLAAFEAVASPDGPFAFGPSFTAADCVLVPQLYSARRFGIDVSMFPRLARAEKAALTTPWVDACAPRNAGRRGHHLLNRGLP